MKKLIHKPLLAISIALLPCIDTVGQALSYPIVETGVHDFYSNTAKIAAPKVGEAFYGQDASYQGFEPSYTDNGNGTITDNVTGLIWQKDMGSKITYTDAFTKADTMTLGGYTDWRVPTIKELYSLILFTGNVNGMTPITPFINTSYFTQPYGNTDLGERLIDAQTWSSTQYVGKTMNGDITVFGVNFVDGRIKGYPRYKPGSGTASPNSMYFRMVRGNSNYGKNNFVNNQDGTITDLATGLMWQQADDGTGRDWENAIAYAENLTLASYSDWRLPNAKELQSIVDYTRCPDVTQSPAIDPLFSTTTINYPDGTSGNYPYFWTSTSHLESSNPYSQGVYIAFGEAVGKMNDVYMDVHGAGAQRSDPKTGNAADYPTYSGPQGDMRVVFNYARCVRTVSNTTSINDTKTPNAVMISPNPASDICTISLSNEYPKVRVEIYNSLGSKVIDQTENNTNRIILNIANLPKGVFVVNTTLNSTTTSNKIVKL